jgi:hypothetical protein
MEYTKKIINNNIEKILAEHIGRRYSEYRNAWALAQPNNIPNFPIHIDIELYDTCNQSCTFCPRNDTTHPNVTYPINTNSRLDDNLIKKIIIEIKKNKLMSVNFGAFADPLVNTKIFQVIKEFMDAGVVDSRIITNGLLLHKYTNSIFESGLVNLYVSLDAFNEDTYFKQRGVGYKKVVSNLLNFLEEKKNRKSKLPITRVSFIETNENKNELKEFVEFWSDKVDHIDLQKLINFNKDPNKSYGSKQWNCIDPFRRVAIVSDGSILPCCSFWGKNLVLGNIKDQSIVDIWNGKEMSKVRKNLISDKSSICNTCQSEN